MLVLADRVHTLSAGVEGDAFLVREGIVRAVGDADSLRRSAPDAEVLDLRGATITPGLSDSHLHLVDWSLARREVQLYGSASAEEAAAAVGRHVEKTGGTGWVRGRGWAANVWHDFPHRKLLDRYVPDRPVFLYSQDMHGLWANTRALELAGITGETPDPDGGRILRDESGEPTGVLLEHAMHLLERHVPPVDEAELEAAVLDAQNELHRLGITAIHSVPSLFPGRLDPLVVTGSLRSKDRLRLRVLQHIPLELLDEALQLGLRSGLGDDWIRIGGIKMFVDGALGSRTAWMREPYVGTDDVGVQVLPDADFRDAVRRAAAGGLASTVHAIGDAAVSLALDVLGAPETRVAALPHRIEHIQLCPPERLGDAGRTGIVLSVQPAHLITDWKAANRYWGVERSRTAYAFGSLLAGGATLAFGSDAPVEPVDPRLGFHAAVLRQDLEGEPAGGWYPEERLDALATLRGYTAGPAHAAGMAGRLGTLAPGALADFVAWDRDPLAVGADELRGLRCTATVVGGEVVWREAAGATGALAAD